MALTPMIVFGFLAMLSWGITDFLAKNAVDKYGPSNSLKITLTLGTSVIFVYSLAFVQLPILSLYVIIFGAAAGISGAIAWIMFYRALGSGKVSIVSPIISSWGIIPFVLGMVLLSESPSIVDVLSVIVIFIGIFLTSINWKKFKSALRSRLHRGAGKAVIAMMGFGLSGFFTKFVVDKIGAFYSLTIIRYISLLLVFIFMPKSNKKFKAEFKFIILLIAVGILDAFGYLMFNFGLSEGLVSVTSAIVSASPFVVLVMAYIFLKERLSANQYLGIVLIIAGFVGLSIF